VFGEAIANCGEFVGGGDNFHAGVMDALNGYFHAKIG
jgi:hypothetical protein